MSKLNVIMNNLMDILLIGGKLIISYIRDGWSWIALLWKDDHLSPMKAEDDFIWNGGVTNERGSRINDTQEDNTLVYDEYTIDGNIIYDGILGDVDDDNG